MPCRWHVARIAPQRPRQRVLVVAALIAVGLCYDLVEIGIDAARGYRRTQTAWVEPRGDHYSYSSGMESYGGGPVRHVTMPCTWPFQFPEATRETCPAIIGLCIAMVAGFVLQGSATLFRISVFYPPTLKAGELWRLFTYAFLHGDFGHLALNIFCLLNMLDLEGVVRGTSYPSHYSLGTFHIAGVMACSAAWTALVGSVHQFGAMHVGASGICFGLDGAMLGACALLLGAQVDPFLEGFLQQRGMIAALHVGLAVLMAFGQRSAGVGHVGHVAGFVAGFSYIILFLPRLGGRSIPIVPCLGQVFFAPREECLAFFSPQYVVRLRLAQQVVGFVVFGGVALAVYNAFVWQKAADAGADGYSVLGSSTRHSRQQAPQAAQSGGSQRTQPSHSPGSGTWGR